MHIIEARNGAEALLEATKLCLHDGVERSPRGQATLDLGTSAVVLKQPWHPLPYGVGRVGLSPALGVAEGLLLVAGTSSPSLLTKLAPFYGTLTTALGRLDGAYGPRAAPGIARAVRQLQEDPVTRQAVALVWDKYDPLSGSKDVPCTVAFTFSVVNGHLDLHAQMRSWDAWLGLPYDLTMFSILLQSVANTLNHDVGELTVTATSLHLYARDAEDAAQLHDPDPNFGYSFIGGVGQPGMEWTLVQSRAGQLLRNVPVQDESLAETWLRETLAARVEALMS